MHLYSRDVRAVPIAPARTHAVSPVWARAGAAVLAGCIVAGLVFLYLWQGCNISSLKAARAQYILRIQALERDHAYLEAKLEGALSRPELEKRAKALGMGPPAPDHIIRLEDDPETDR